MTFRSIFLQDKVKLAGLTVDRNKGIKMIDDLFIFKVSIELKILFEKDYLSGK